MKLVFLGLSITSSWGNGHASTYRALVGALAAAGHDVLFLERDRPWYRDNRDLPRPPYGRTEIYDDLTELARRFAGAVRSADAVIVGSYVPDGVAVGDWVTRCARGVTAFYDIDTPVTLAKLTAGDHEYIDPELVRRYDLYLSFTGGPTLRRLETEHRARRARALYCSFDPTDHYPSPDVRPTWDLGYLGTYSDDRQPTLEALLLEPARRLRSARFVVGGPQYPDGIAWPANVERTHHVPPPEHRHFYGRQRFTLNVTRASMRAAGHSPSVRLFEAAACGVPIISDRWAGVEEVLAPDREVLVADTTKDVLRILRELSDDERRAIAARARARVLAEHTPAHRAAELEAYVTQVVNPSFSLRKEASPAWRAS
jgi:spore maturation protein CgeB